MKKQKNIYCGASVLIETNPFDENKEVIVYDAGYGNIYSMNQLPYFNEKRNWVLTYNNFFKDGITGFVIYVWKGKHEKNI